MGRTPKSLNDVPKSVRQERGRKGGVKSGEARREKRKFRHLASAILDLRVPKTDANGNKVGEMSERERLVVDLFRWAHDGDLNALKLIMALDTATEVEDKEAAAAEATPEQGAQNRPPMIPKLRAFLDWQLHRGATSCYLYGTTRSGKTYAVVQWLLEGLADGWLKPRGGGQAMVLIAGQTVPFLRNGVAAYIKELAPKISDTLLVLNNGMHVKHPNGEIRVQSFDGYYKALSAQWTCVFFNEGNYVGGDVVDSVRIRTSGLVICDYNPSVGEWWATPLQTEANTLFCRFGDNPYLSPQQLDAIESIRERGEAAPAGSYDDWFYRVYYLGQFAEMGGGVFMRVHRITDAEFEAAELVCVHGIDFGDVEDPNALVAVKVDTAQKLLYVRCEYYETATDDVRMVEVLNARRVQRLVCETATGGQTRMRNFKALGFGGWVVPAQKTRVCDGVYNLTPYKIMCADDISYGEFRSYKIDGGRFTGADHCIDATRYVASLIITGKIR